MIGFVQRLESTPDSPYLAIALFVQGLAIGMLKADSPVAKGMSAAIARGIEVVACEYSMKVRKVQRDGINASVVRFVPFRGVEIVKRQADGWAYLRP